MKSLLGGVALRGTLLAVLIVVAGALTIAACDAESAPERAVPVASEPTPTTTVKMTTSSLVEQASATVTSRDWRSISAPAFTDDFDALLAVAEEYSIEVGPRVDETDRVDGVEPTPTTVPATPVVTIVATQPPPTTTTTTSVAVTTTTATGGHVSSGDEATFVSLINGTRSSAGVAGLSRDGGLDSYARWWAEQMAIAGSISHSGMGGIDASWTISAENIGSGGTAEILYSSFVGSSGHLSNIVDARFSHVGVGVWIDGSGQLWTVHIFGGK